MDERERNFSSNVASIKYLLKKWKFIWTVLNGNFKSIKKEDYSEHFDSNSILVSEV